MLDDKDEFNHYSLYDAALLQEARALATETAKSIGFGVRYAWSFCACLSDFLKKHHEHLDRALNYEKQIYS